MRGEHPLGWLPESLQRVTPTAAALDAYIALARASHAIIANVIGGAL